MTGAFAPEIRSIPGIILKTIEKTTNRNDNPTESSKRRSPTSEKPVPPDRHPNGDFSDEYSFDAAAIKNASEGFCICHEIAEYPHVRFTVWNDRMTEITGYTMEQINRLGWYQSVYPDPETQRQAAERMARMRTGEDLHAEEWTITRSDGTERVLNISTWILKGGDNKSHVLALMQDITERKKTEEALRRERDVVARLMETNPVGILLIDRQGQIQFANKRAEHILGLIRPAPQAPYRSPSWKITDDNGKPLPRNELPVNRVLQTGRPVYDSRYAIKWPDGRMVLLSVNAAPILDEGGQADGIVTAITDITDQVRSEKALRLSEQEKATILASVAEHVTFQNKNLELIWANRAAAESVNLSLDKLVGRPCYQIWNARRKPCPNCPVKKSLKSGRPHESEMTTYDGRVWWVRGYPVFDDDNNIIGAVEVTQNITERKKAEEALRKSEQRYQELFNSLVEGIGLADQNDIIKYVNPAFANIFEIESPEAMLGTCLLDYLSDEHKRIIRKDARNRQTGQNTQYELKIVTAQKNEKTVYFSATPRFNESGDYAGVLVSVMDITERKNAEQQRRKLQEKLEKAQRMESLGILAGGVAHDLNNILGPLVGYPELILSRLPDGSPLAKQIQRIASAALRASEVIQDLLTLARRGRYEMTPTDLNSIIKEYLDSANFVRISETHRDVKVSLKLDETIANITGSAIHLSKLIMNLVVNAYDAMPEGGELIIRTTQEHIEKLAGGYEKIRAGEYILLKIKDTGIGIDASELDKVFEPYFSKKKMGVSGSGLGLSVVYGIVKDHKGYYDIFSEPGKGTEFVIYFPVSGENPVDRPESCAAGGGCETVLVVDDSAEQREVCRDLIQSLGYHVDCVTSGREAIRYVENKKPDIVIMDMIMEDNFDGLDTYREMIKINPGQKAIIVSGFSATERVNRMQKMGAGAYVKKPFTRDVIAKAIRDELNVRRPQ